MTAETTHKATLELGEAVVGHEVKWASATLITGADHQSEGGCLRRTWFERVGGYPRDETEQMKAGTVTHKDIESHLLTGSALGPTAMAGAGFIPEPGPGLLIEHPILVGKDGKMTGVYLRAGNIPIAGHIDLVNLRGEYIDANAELRKDPKGTVEIKDWKSTSDLKWAKTAAQVADTIQMNTYGRAAFNMWQGVEHVRLTHVYFQRGARPKALLSTSLRPFEQIDAKWKYAEAIVRTLVDVIRETDVEKVSGNRKACHSYHKACPHLARCSVGSFNSLNDNLYSKVAQDFRQENAMGLLSTIPGMGTIPAAPNQSAQPLPAPGGALEYAQVYQQAPPGMMTQAPPTDPYLTGILQNQGQAPAPQPYVDPTPAVDMRATLAAEEAQLRAQQTQTQQQMQPVQMGLRDVWQRIQAHNRGVPSLFGAAAQAVAQACGVQIAPGQPMPGVGQLGAIKLDDAANLYVLCDELEGKPSPAALPSAQVPMQIVPPPQYAAPAAVQQAPAGLLAPEAPASNPQLAQAPIAPSTHETSPPDEPKRGRGRPKKSQDTAPAQQTATPGAPPPSSPAANTFATDAVSPSLEVFIDCRPEYPTKNLAGYVEYINSTLAARYCVGDDGKPTTQDVRSAPKNSILGYSGWKGAVREVVLANPPPAGPCHLDVRGDELKEIVADALYNVCARTEALYVRGVK